LISSFEIYGDSNLRAILGGDFKMNDKRQIVIEPAYHFSATRVEPNGEHTEYGLAKQGESWGVFDTLYLLQRDDERTGKKLKKPKLWIVKIDKKGILSIEKAEGDPILEKAAREVFEGFPQLAPAEQRGKPVVTFYQYPISFRKD